jgi:hypothetical protein
MMTDLSLETGPQEAGAICDCCGTRSTTVHGFVYESGDAFAIYYAGWSVQHPERGVTMAIATGEWSEGSGPADRVSIGVEARSHETEIHFSVLEPNQSPWGETQLFGEMLPREKALQHPSLRKTLEVAELVVREDPRVHSFLWGQS